MDPSQDPSQLAALIAEASDPTTAGGRLAQLLRISSMYDRSSAMAAVAHCALQNPAMERVSFEPYLLNGNLAAWMSPLAQMYFLDNPASARGAARNIDVGQGLPDLARTMLASWWAEEKDGGFLLGYLVAQSINKTGSAWHKRAVRACFLYLNCLPLWRKKTPAELVSTLDEIEAWTLPGGSPLKDSPVPPVLPSAEGVAAHQVCFIAANTILVKTRFSIFIQALVDAMLFGKERTKKDEIDAKADLADLLRSAVPDPWEASCSPSA